MIKVHPIQQNNSLPISLPEATYRSQKRIAARIFLLYLTVMMVLFYVMSGCSGPSPHRLQAHFETEPHPSQVIQGKLPSHSQDRLPVGMAIVFPCRFLSGSLRDH